MTNKLTYEPRLPELPATNDNEAIYNYLIRERIALFDELRGLRRTVRALRPG